METPGWLGILPLMRLLLIAAALLAGCGGQADLPVKEQDPTFIKEPLTDKIMVWTEVESGRKWFYYIETGNLVLMPING